MGFSTNNWLILQIFIKFIRVMLVIKIILKYIEIYVHITLYAY